MKNLTFLKLSLSDYFGILEMNIEEPNFFMSKEYWKASGWTPYRYMEDDGREWDLIDQCEDFDDGILLIDKDGYIILSPFLEKKSHKFNYMINCEEDLNWIQKGVWTSFDKEYIYDPKVLVEREGSGLKVFRKNVNHFMNHYNGDLMYDRVYNLADAFDILEEWLRNNIDQEIYDAITIMSYINYFPENIWGLYSDKVLMGINIWDENWKYINFRYSFAINNERGINDYLRWRFYKSILHKGKLVNDGGDLGLPGLKRFKERLQPIEIRQRYSVKFKGGIERVEV